MSDITKIRLEGTDYNIKDNTARTNIGTLSNLTTENKTNLVEAINEVATKDITATPSKPIDMKKVIFIGDSYASRSDNWVNFLVSKLGLSSSEFYKSALGSTGFVSANAGTTFLTLLNNVIDTLTDTQKQEITHVIVCGGANDNTYTATEIDNAISTFVTRVNSVLPNAKTLIGEIGWTSISNDIVNYSKVVDTYSKCNKYMNCYYLNGVQHILHNYNLLTSDHVHPTETGCIALASGIHQAILTGSCEVIYTQLLHKLNEGDNLKNVYEAFNNNLVQVYSNRLSVFDVSIDSLVANGANSIELTSDILEYAKGSYFEQNKTFIVAQIVIDSVLTDVNCTIGVYDGKLKLYPLKVAQGGTYVTLENITRIFLPQYTITMNSLNC